MACAEVHDKRLLMPRFGTPIGQPSIGARSPAHLRRAAIGKQEHGHWTIRGSASEAASPANISITAKETIVGAQRNSSNVTNLHEFLGVTPKQIDKDMRGRGMDPAYEVAALRRLGQVLAAQFAPQAQREEARASAASKQFPMHDESVAAGMPAWAGCAEAPLGTSIWDIVEQSDPSTTMWVLVSGWSMRDVGINDGDTVLVDTTREARSGDIVVVHIAGEGQVVKRIRMMPGDPIVLESANPDFAPRVINDALSLRIHGVVVGRVGKL